MITEIFNKHEITGIESDSRIVKPGDLFFGISKQQSLQHCFQAIEKGAKVIISYPEHESFLKNKNIFFYPSLNPSLDLAITASSYYSPLPEFNFAVTGTNGKSSVASFVRQIIGFLNFNTASIGTVGIESSVKLDDEFLKKLPTLTTLDSLNFFKLLSYLKKQSINHTVFEASSIGIDQYRCYGIPLVAAGFTNLTQDHLDYHVNMENYFHAKSKLFSEILDKEKTAVLNINDSYFSKLESVCNARDQKIISYGLDNSKANLNASIKSLNNNSITFDMFFDGKIYKDLLVNLVGAFQLENLLCAVGLVVSLGVDLRKVIEIFQLIKPVKGRMECVKTFNEASVFVDYAHTPDALKNSIISLKKHTKGKLHVLFGCGGNRDISKRNLMGSIACAYADNVIITDDNPRFEDPEKIRHDILNGCNEKSTELPDRYNAISYAVSILKKDDTLLIAGKGHENVQIIKDQEIVFDDREKVIQAIERLEGK